MLITKTFPRKSISYLFLLTAITCIILFPSLQNGFTNWDDPKYLLNNEFVRELSFSNGKDIFMQFVIRDQQYVPLTILSFAIEYHFAQLNPLVYHLNNLLLHMFNVLLVFYFIYLIKNDIKLAFFVGLLFGIHPLHVESVAWIAERKDVLYTFFYLSALIAYVQHSKKGEGTGKFYFVSMGLFFLSLCAKPQAVTFVLAILLMDYYFQRPLNRKGIVEKIPFFSLALLFVFIFLFRSQTLGEAKIAAFSNFEKIIFASYAFITYIAKLLFPHHLSAFYPYPAEVNGSLPLYYYLTPAMVVLLCGVVWIKGKRSRDIVFGFIFFALHMLPVLLFIPIGDYIMADRYTYVSSIGIFFLLGQLGRSIVKNKNDHRLFRIILTVYMIILATISWNRCKIWKNEITLWNDVISKYPKCALAYVNRGLAFSKRGLYDQAFFDYNHALKFDPMSAKAYNNRGVVFSKVGKTHFAIDDYNQATSLKPDYSEAYNNRGMEYYLNRKYQSALNDFTKAIELDSQNLIAYLNRAQNFFLLERYHQAFQDYQKALQLDPKNKEINEKLNVMKQLISDDKR